MLLFPWMNSFTPWVKHPSRVRVGFDWFPSALETLQKNFTGMYRFYFFHNVSSSRASVQHFQLAISHLLNVRGQTLWKFTSENFSSLFAGKGFNHKETRWDNACRYPSRNNIRWFRQGSGPRTRRVWWPAEGPCLLTFLWQNASKYGWPEWH